MSVSRWRLSRLIFWSASNPHEASILHQPRIPSVKGAYMRAREVGQHRQPPEAVVDEAAQRVDRLSVAVALRLAAPAGQSPGTGSTSRRSTHSGIACV